jgi:hypothetical protein
MARQLQNPLTRQLTPEELGPARGTPEWQARYADLDNWGTTENCFRRHYGDNARRAAEISAAIAAENNKGYHSGCNHNLVRQLCDELDGLTRPEFSPLYGPRCPHCSELLTRAELDAIKAWTGPTIDEAIAADEASAALSELFADSAANV